MGMLSSYKADKLAGCLGQLLFLAVLIAELILAYYAFAHSMLPLLFCGVLPCGALLAILFVRIYLPSIASSIAFGFIMPRIYLKDAPLVLSPFAGMITNERYAEAYAGLLPLVQEYPGNPDAILLFAKASMNMEGYAEVGFQAMEQHFTRKHREKSRNYMALLLYYSDMAMRYQHTGFLADILENELQKKYYTEAEKKAIGIRLQAIRRM